MPEPFLILLSAGVMLAAAVSDPRQVALRWLRLAGIVGLTMAGLAAFFAARVQPRNLLLFVPPLGMILLQLAFVQVARRATQRALAAMAFACAVATGAILLRQSVIASINPILLALGCVLTAACCGLVLMDMLLGHAYLTASPMTIAPFVRLNLAVAAALLARAAVGAAVLLLHRPEYMFWGKFGLYIGTRWLVGIIVPGLFVFMAHDCIRRRSTQSATGILYVAGVLVFIGEIIGLYLLVQTGLPL